MPAADEAPGFSTQKHPLIGRLCDLVIRYKTVPISRVCGACGEAIATRSNRLVYNITSTKCRHIYIRQVIFSAQTHATIRGAASTLCYAAQG